jgi:cytochrome o ubiquinol oxidase subunit I
MWVPAIVAFVAVLAAVIVHTFNYKRDFYIPAEEVTSVENARTRVMAAALQSAQALQAAKA